MVENGTEVMMEGVKLIFTNFAGRKRKYNEEGARNFGVLLDDDVAYAMEQDGWNVKRLNLREDAEEGDTPQAWLPVKVKYEGTSRPPRVIMVTDANRTVLDESEVSLIDGADIENVDLIVRAYVWDVNNNTGVTAYLKSAYITIHEDELDKKYNRMADRAQATDEA